MSKLIIALIIGCIIGVLVAEIEFRLKKFFNKIQF